MKLILVVEPDDTMRENIGEILEISGYRVEYAVDGLEGLQKLFSLLPDLVVCNKSLPGMAGDELIEALQMSPKTKDIPYILLTPTREVGHLWKNIPAYPINYLSIPFGYERLKNAVESHLKPVRFSLQNVS